VLRASPSYTALLRCTVVHVVATGCLLAGVPYFAEHALGDKRLLGLLVAAFVLPNLLTTPLWRAAGARAGARAGLIAATAVFASGCLLLAPAAALPAGCAVAVMALAGTGHAGQLLFVYAMLAECTAADTARTGRGRAGAMSGCFTAGETAGLALGPFVFALALQLSGYASSGTGHAAGQSGTALAGIVTGVAVLPALGALSGLLWLRRYRLPPPPPQPRPGAGAGDGPGAGVVGGVHGGARGPLRSAGRAARVRP
jgi:Na+/melibiose symporter-like transporter